MLIITNIIYIYINDLEYHIIGVFEVNKSDCNKDSNEYTTILLFRLPLIIEKHNLSICY